MSEHSTVPHLERQLDSYTKQKLTPASKKSRKPAQEIHASVLDSKGNPSVIIFKLATVESTYLQGQKLVYKGRCECRRTITVLTTYKGTNALWPPSSGVPELCQTCQGGPS